MTLQSNLSDYFEQLRRRNAEFPLISIQEIAKQYGRSVRTLRRWEAKGLMPPRIKHGRRQMYQKTEIALMMSTRQQNPTG
jgi:predicted site-specific integrase-resolvase